MIVFLTLCYVAFLAVLIKLGVIKFTLWWKLSPLVWMLLLLVVLFLPMQWGAPSGTVNVYQFVVEIIPNVTGQVVEVPVEPMQPLKKDDVLFQIDRRPFQAEVDRLRAALAAAEQDVPQLKASFEGAVASVDQAKAQQVLAKLNFDRAVAILKDNEAAISQVQVDQTRQSLAAADAAVSVAEAARNQAELAYKSEINGENTRVAELKAQLAGAELDLSFTTVRAPSDGYVVAQVLRPGARVGNFPMRSFMAFVDSGESRLIVGLDQYVLRHVTPGDSAEVIFKVLPGQTFHATVDTIVPINAQAQIQASGLLPNAPSSQLAAQTYGVVLELDDERLDVNMLKGGAIGTAAIYTDNVQATHVIRRVMIRMESWMNYVLR